MQSTIAVVLPTQETLPVPTTMLTPTPTSVNPYTVACCVTGGVQVSTRFAAHEVRQLIGCSLGTLQEMLKDTVRTETYMQAMLKNKHLFKDKVIDVPSPS